MYKTYIVLVRVDITNLHRRNVESIRGMVIPKDTQIHTGVCELLGLKTHKYGVEVYPLDEFVEAVNDQECDDLTGSFTTYVYKEAE